MTRIRSPWALADRKGSGRGQWTRIFSFIKIWLVHFQVFSILFQNNFRYSVSQIIRFQVYWYQYTHYFAPKIIPLPPWPGLSGSQTSTCSFSVAGESSILLDEAAYKNKKVEWEKSNEEHLGLEANTNSASHHPKVRRSTEFTLPQAPVFRISKSLMLSRHGLNVACGTHFPR